VFYKLNFALEIIKLANTDLNGHYFRHTNYNFYAFFIRLVRSVYLAHVILRGLITLVIFRAVPSRTGLRQVLTSAAPTLGTCVSVSLLTWTHGRVISVRSL
jgi:hypothetical protein